MSRFGDEGPASCSMGPKQSLERVIFSLKSEIPISEGGSATRSWPPMSPKWLKFLVGMIWMDPWDLGDMVKV